MTSGQAGTQSQAGTQPNWRSRAAVLAIGTFAVGTDAFVIAGVLPSIADSLRVSVGAAGQLVTVFALAYALTAPFVGALTAGWSRRTTLLAALGVFAAGNAVTALAPTYALVLGSRVVAAVGAALFTATASATAARLAGPERRGRAIAIVMFGVTSSLVLGTPIGTALSSVTNWRTTLWFVTALGLVAAIAVAIWLPRLPGEGGAAGTRVVRRLVGPLRVPGVAGLLLGTFVAFLGIYTPYTYFSAVYEPTTGGDGRLLASMLLVFGIAATVGNLTAGTLADRIGPARVIVGATALLAAVFAALPLLRGELWLAVPTVAVSGVLSFAVTTPQQQWLLTLAPEAGSVATSLYQAALYLAVSASGVLGAVVLDVRGSGWLGPVSGAVVLVAAVVAAVAGQGARGAAGRRFRTGADARSRAEAARTR